MTKSNADNFLDFEYRLVAQSETSLHAEGCRGCMRALTAYVVPNEIKLESAVRGSQCGSGFWGDHAARPGVPRLCHQCSLVQLNLYAIKLCNPPLRL